MNINFETISFEDFEFLCEDLLRTKGFTIKSRPSRGPDKGKDIIAVRDVSDDMGITFREEWLVECNHFAANNRSVREVHIGNFEVKMKLHNANRYLLITSSTVSENVKDQLKAISEDQSSSRMATFWAKHDLVRMLKEYTDVHDRYFSSWEKQAIEAANMLNSHHGSAHRGAILWCPEVTAIFEARANNTYALQKDKVRKLLQDKGLKELAYGEGDTETTWVILVHSQFADELNELIWGFCPSDDTYTIVQKEITFDRIWQFHYSPVHKKC
jgi:hypothetical protein